MERKYEVLKMESKEGREKNEGEKWLYNVRKECEQVNSKEERKKRRKERRWKEEGKK